MTFINFEFIDDNGDLIRIDSAVLSTYIDSYVTRTGPFRTINTFIVQIQLENKRTLYWTFTNRECAVIFRDKFLSKYFYIYNKTPVKL